MKAIIKTNPTPTTVPAIRLFRAGPGGGKLEVACGLPEAVTVEVNLIVDPPGLTVIVEVLGCSEVTKVKTVKVRKTVEGCSVLTKTPVGGGVLSSVGTKLWSMVNSWRHEYNRENRSVL